LIHTSKPRVCAVSYLNTVPLVWGLLHGEQRGLFDLSFSLPAECAARIATREADIGIVPVIEVARQNLRIVPGVGIACRGAVRSILLISKVPLSEIQTLAADSGSRTSVALSRIILQKNYGAEPVVVEQPPNLPKMLDGADAALIIGDPALRLNLDEPPFPAIDLGHEWMELTGLPMVFAVWAAHPDFELPDYAEPAFRESARFGARHLDEIVRDEHKRRGVSAALAREYLSRHIVFELGKEERAGMEQFLHYAAALPESLESRKVSV
jgi:chorismate dehydratase